MFFYLKQPRIKQSEAAECMLACFALCAELEGQYFPMQAYRNIYPHFQNGGTFQDLFEICQENRVEFEAYAAPDLKEAAPRFPVIAQINECHFIVVEKIEKSRALISDPEMGRYHCSVAELEQMYSGYFAVLDFSENILADRLEGTLNEADVSIGEISKPRKAIVIALNLVFNAAAVGGIYLVGQAMNAGSGDAFRWYMAGFVLLNIISIWVLTAKNLRMYSYSQGAGEDAKNSMIESLARKPFVFHISRHLATVMAAFSSVDAAAETRVLTFDRVYLSSIFIAFTVGVALLIHVPLGIVLMIGTLISVAIRVSISNALRDRASQTALSKGREYSHVIAYLRGINALRFMGLSQYILDISFSVFRKTRMARHHYLRLLEIVNSVQLQLKVLEFAIIILVAQATVPPEQIGSFYTILLLRYFIDLKLTELLPAYEAHLANKALVERLEAIMQVPDDDLELERPRIKAEIETDLGQPLISVQGLGFQFQRDREIFSDLSFEVKRGSFTAIIGETGSGKSTLMAMLMGILPPQSGQVLFDGRPLVGPNRTKLMSVSACVFQKEGLIPGQIQENVAGFMNEYEKKPIRDALEKACVLEEVDSLPMQLATFVREDGGNLSSGQMQRLMIARALYFDPDILFLDEATANLDKDTEARVLKNLKSLNKTIVFVSHSHSVREIADQVIDLQN